jgi:dihydrodipicolinate synthase/N-acetylneuraminate lyase
MTGISAPHSDEQRATDPLRDQPNRSAAVPLSGIIPPLVTPLLTPERLDVVGLERLVDHLVSGGVHGLFILGTTGEGPSLSQSLRRELITRVTTLAAGRLPVLVGISDAAVVDSVALAAHAADQGAAAVVAAPPFYFPASQSQVATWAKDLAGRVPLPLVLYNMPEMVKTVIEPATLAGLCACEGIVGLKDSGGDLATFAAYAEVIHRERPEWGLFIGPELLYLEAHRLGATGAVPGGANVLPGLFVTLHGMLTAGNSDGVIACQRPLEMLAKLYAVSGQPGGVIVGIKTALLTLGVCGDATASPFTALPPADIDRVWSIVEALGPVLAEIPAAGVSIRDLN